MHSGHRTSISLKILLESFEEDLRVWPQLPRPDLFMCPRFLECGTKTTFPPVRGLNVKASYKNVPMQILVPTS